MQYMKVNQVISQRPIFSFKGKFPDEHNNNTKGGFGRQIQNANQQIKLNATIIKIVLTSLIQTQFHLS